MHDKAAGSSTGTRGLGPGVCWASGLTGRVLHASAGRVYIYIICVYYNMHAHLREVDLLAVRVRARVYIYIL